MYEYQTVIKVIFLYKEKKSYREIEKITKVSKSCICMWIFLYYDDYDALLKRYYKQHKDSKNTFLESLNKNIFEYIEKIVKTNPFLTYKKFIFMINDKFNIKLNNKNLKTILDNIGITKKKIKQRVIKSKDFLNKIIQKRKEFITIINKQLIENIICIDETGFNTFINKNTKGYSKKSVEINIPVSKLHFSNQSLLMALSINNVIHYDIVNENVETTIYFDFIKALIEKLKNLKDNKNYVFIFDNVRFHHSKKTLDLINSSNYTYFFVPPYSPNLNPIENVNGIIKDNYNNLAIADYVNNSSINMLNVHSFKKTNKDTLIKENNIEKENIKERRRLIKDKYTKICKDKIQNIKNKHFDNIDEVQNNIIKCKKEIKVEQNKEIKNIISDEKKNRNKRVLDNKINDIILAKKYIINSIQLFNNQYNSSNIKKIFLTAFLFNHESVENELKDRLSFK